MCVFLCVCVCSCIPAWPRFILHVHHWYAGNKQQQKKSQLHIVRLGLLLLLPKYITNISTVHLPKCGHWNVEIKLCMLIKSFGFCFIYLDFYSMLYDCMQWASRDIKQKSNCPPFIMIIQRPHIYIYYKNEQTTISLHCKKKFPFFLIEVC